MIRFFIQEFPQNLFEPIFGMAIAGIFLILFFGKKLQIHYGKTIVAIILFMCFWRLMLHSNMRGRYCSGLILPAILLTAMVCVKLPEMIKNWISLIRNDFQWEKTKWNAVPFLLCILISGGIVLAMIIKNLRIDPENFYLQKTIAVYREDAKQWENHRIFITKPGEKNRVAYYAGIRPTEKLQTMPVIANEEDPDEIFNRIVKHWSIPGVTYFFTFQKKSQKEMTDLSDISPDLKVTELCRFATSKKRKNEVVLYRLTSSSIAVSDASFPKDHVDQKQKNLFLNPCFEEEIKPEILQKQLEGEQKKHPELSLAENRIFPARWGFRLLPSSVCLTNQNAIEGKYSLLMTYEGNPCVFHSNFIYGQGEYLLTLLLKNMGSESALFTLTPYLEDKERNRTFSDTWTFSIAPGGVKKITCPLNMNQKNMERFYISFQTDGCIMVDAAQIRKITTTGS